MCFDVSEERIISIFRVTESGATSTWTTCSLSEYFVSTFLRIGGTHEARCVITQKEIINLPTVLVKTSTFTSTLLVLLSVCLCVRACVYICVCVCVCVCVIVRMQRENERERDLKFLHLISRITFIFYFLTPSQPCLEIEGM